jgi:hypothetical protein
MATFEKTPENSRQEELTEKIQAAIAEEVLVTGLHVREILGVLEYVKLTLSMQIFRQTLCEQLHKKGDWK